MKKIIQLSIAICFLLIACQGSDIYRGYWKAMTVNGDKFEINFDAKSFTIKDSTGKVDKYGYLQNSVNIHNYVETYGLVVSGMSNLQINFPFAKDESLGLIKDENGTIIFTICRAAYKKHDEVY